MKSKQRARHVVGKVFYDDGFGEKPHHNPSKKEVINRKKKKVTKKKKKTKATEIIFYHPLIYLLTNNTLYDQDIVYVPVKKEPSDYTILEDDIIDDNIKLLHDFVETLRNQKTNYCQKYFILMIPKQSWNQALDKQLMLKTYYSASERKNINIRRVR